jgi:hypothetical protein
MNRPTIIVCDIHDDAMKDINLSACKIIQARDFASELEKMTDIKDAAIALMEEHFPDPSCSFEAKTLDRLLKEYRSEHDAGR